MFLFLSSAELGFSALFHGVPVSFLSISRRDAVETHEGSIAYIIIKSGLVVCEHVVQFVLWEGVPQFN